MDETLTQEPPAQVEPPIRRLWSSLHKEDGFTRTFEEFSEDMQDPDNVAALHSSLAKKHKEFTVPLEDFAADMSGKKKDQSADGSTPATEPTSVLPSAVQPPVSSGGASGDQPFIQFPTADNYLDDALNQPKVLPADFTGPLEQGTYQQRSDTGTPAEGTSYVDPAVRPATEQPEAADVADDGFFSSFGKSLWNGLDPRRIGGNLLDYGGDLFQMLSNAQLYDEYGNQIRPIKDLGAPLTSDKATDAIGADLLAQAKASDLPLSQAAQQSFLDKPSLAAAGNLAGGGVASIVPVAAATALGGPAAGAAVGAGLGISSTKDTARAAGISDDEATITATILAPIQGALEAIGVKDPGVARLAIRETVREAVAATGGKLTQTALAAAARKVLPEIAKRAGKGALHEGGTEFAQGVVEGEGQVLADQLRDNPDAPKGQGRYGTTQADVVRSSVEQALIGGVLGGGLGTLHGPANAQSAATPLAPINGNTYELRRPSGQVELSGLQILHVDEQTGQALVRGTDGTGKTIEQQVPAGRLFEASRPALPAPAEGSRRLPITESSDGAPIYGDVDTNNNLTHIYSAPDGSQSANPQEAAQKLLSHPDGPSRLEQALAREAEPTPDAAPEPTAPVVEAPELSTAAAVQPSVPSEDAPADPAITVGGEATPTPETTGVPDTDPTVVEPIISPSREKSNLEKVGRIVTKANGQAITFDNGTPVLFDFDDKGKPLRGYSADGYNMPGPMFQNYRSIREVEQTGEDIANAYKQVASDELRQRRDNAPKITVLPVNGRYHGTSARFELGNTYDRSQNHNLYGSGFYTTDNLAVAGGESGYTKKGAGNDAAVYQVDWVGDHAPKLINLDKPLAPEVFAVMQRVHKQFAPQGEQLDNSAHGTQVFAQLKEALIDGGLTKTEVDDEYQGISDVLVDAGFDGFQHEGGGRVKKDGVKHDVHIYFEPINQKTAKPNLKITEVAKSLLPPRETTKVGTVLRLPAATPAPERVVAPTKQQLAANTALDALDGYNKLTPKQKASAIGSKARAALANLGSKAGLDVTVGNDYSVTVTRAGRRVTRVNEYTATTPAANHVPLADRPEAARPFMERMLSDAEANIATLQGAGLGIRGINYNAQELQGAIRDIRAGKNTLRAQQVLDALETAHREGIFRRTTGTGMGTTPDDIIVADALESKPSEAPPRNLSDAELDNLIAEDAKVKQAVDSYVKYDGTIDYNQIIEDGANGLRFLFDIESPTANKLIALANERATQPESSLRPASPPEERAATPTTANSGDTGPISETGTDTGSETQGPASAAEPTSGSAQEVGPSEAKKAEIRADIDAASQRIKDRREARRKGGKLFSSPLPIGEIDVEDLKDALAIARGHVQLGVLGIKNLIAKIREAGLDESDASDAALTPHLRELLTGESFADDNYVDNRTAAKKAADAAAPEGQKARQHPLHYSDDVQAGLTDEQKYYTPRKRIENAAEASDYVDKHGTGNAYNFLIHGGGDEAFDNMAPVVKDAMRSDLAKRLGDESAAALKAGDKPEAERLFRQQLDIIGQRAQVLTESAQVLSQNQYEGDVGQNPERAFHDYVNGVKEAQEKKASRDGDNGKSGDKAANKRRRNTVERTLADPAVKAATARAVGQRTGEGVDVKEKFGTKNRLFTRDKLVEMRKNAKGQLFSSVVPISPVVLYEAGYYFEGGVRKFSDWSAKMIRSYGSAIRPRLSEIYEQSKKDFITQGGENKGFDGLDAVTSALQTELADNLADRIVGEVRPKSPGVFNPVQEMLDTLTKKVRDTLSPTAKKPKNAREAIVHALQNKAEYSKVFEESKALVADKIDKLKISDPAKQQLRDALNKYYADKIGQPFSTKQADQVLQIGAKELEIKLEKLVRQHADVREATQQTLVDKLVKEAGLTPEQAKEYADILNKRFAELARGKAQSVVGRILAPIKTKLPGSRLKTVVDKLSEALDLADATTIEGGDTASPAAALLSKMGAIPDVTVEDAATYRELIDKVRKANIPTKGIVAGREHEFIVTKDRQEAIVNLLRFGSEKLKKVSWWDKTRALQYAFRLSGLDTQGRNLGANIKHTLLEQGIVSRLYNIGRNRTTSGSGVNVKAYFSAQGNGIAEAAYTMATGFTGNEQEKFGDNSPLEASKNKFLKAWAYVGRAMVAGDQLTSVPTASGRTAELALREGFDMARSLTDEQTGAPLNLKGRALRDAAFARANEILYNTKEALGDIDVVLDSEGLPEITQADVRAGNATQGEYIQRARARSIRKADLLRQVRAKDNPAMMKDVAEYTRIQTLNNDPQGLIGKAIDQIQGLKTGNKVADFLITQVVPFMRVPYNSMSRKLEWGLPILTAARIASGRTSMTISEDSKYSRKLTDEEKWKMGIRAAVGTAGYASLAALAQAGALIITGPPKNNDDDLLNPPQSLIINNPLTGGQSVWSYKDTNFEYPLTVMAGVDEYVRKQKGKGQNPSIMRRIGVGALHSAAWTVTQGPFSGGSDLAAAMEKIMQGNYTAADSYLKRMLVATVKTGTVPAIFNQSGQAYREFAGMPQRERKSNDFVSEMEVSFFGNTPYAEVGEDRINFAGQPIVLDRDGMSVWTDGEDGPTVKIARLLVEKGLMPPRQNPTDDDLMLYDPKGERVTPMSDPEFHDYVVAKGEEFIRQLHTTSKHGGVILDNIRDATTAKDARRARNEALSDATEYALKLIEKKRAAEHTPATFELSKKIQRDKDAANYKSITNADEPPVKVFED